MPFQGFVCQTCLRLNAKSQTPATVKIESQPPEGRVLTFYACAAHQPMVTQAAEKVGTVTVSPLAHSS